MSVENTTYDRRITGKEAKEEIEGKETQREKEAGREKGRRLEEEKETGLDE